MPAIAAFTPELLESHLLVDVRTPLEYAEDHLPGAVNVPLLTNEERVEIGTLYKQTGPIHARRRGLELTAHRFPEIVATIGAAAGERPIVVYCWRGGLRSKTVAILLDLAGYPVAQLKGGYKAFRNVVVDYFADFRPPAPLVVLHGMTGIGKTTFLLGLDRQRFSVIDLEGLASHRGSAFGALGLAEQPPQKQFETRLWDAFRRVPADRPLLVEGESRRIGRLTLPGNLYDVMRTSTKIWGEASLATRVARIDAEYGREEYRDGLAEALERIKPKLGGEHYAALVGHLQRWELPELFAGLMEHYYDRLYYKHRPWVEDARLDLEDYAAAAEELAAVLARK